MARPGELVRGAPARALRRESRLIQGIELARDCEVVCRSCQLESSALRCRGSRHEARSALAYLARQQTEATQRELAELVSVSRPDSVPNLARRFARRLAERDEARERPGELKKQLRLRQAR